MKVAAQTETADLTTTGRRNWLIVFLAPVVLAAAAYALLHLAREANYDTVVATLLGMPPWQVAIAVALTFASFGTLTLYDLNAFQALGTPKRWREVAPGAFAAFAVSQTIGFGPLSGAAVRMRFYIPLGVAPATIARLVAFVTLSFGFGLVALGACSALAAVPEVAVLVGLSPDLLRVVGFGLVGLVTLVVAVGGRELRFRLFGVRRIRMPNRPILVRQLAVTAVDVCATAGVLWILLPQGTIGFAAFLPVFTIAVALGVVSHVPAGLGVFEAVVLAAIQGAAPASEIIAALALYRVIYHALPIAVASIAIASLEVGRLASQPAARAVVGAFAGLAPQTIAAFALILGAMLVFSGVTPAKPSDLNWLASILPLHLIETAHLLASVLGAGLMVSARGLAYRLDGAWLVALVAASLAIVLSIAKALALFEAAGLAVFCILLLVSRRRFRRPAAILNQSLTPQWVAAIFAVLVSALVILLFAYDQSQFGLESWTRFEFAAEAPRGLRALLGTALALGAVGLWTLLRPVHEPIERPRPGDIERAVAIAEAQPSADANLVRMGDKSLLFSADGRGFVMYGRHGRSWIALFGPVGPPALWPELVWQFVEMARRAGGRAAFYEVDGETLSIYADAGLRCLKLGEEARVDLSAFSLEGPSRKDHRYTLGRGRRDGLEVEVVAPDAVPPLLDDLERISQEWLGDRGEKAFSLGAFSRGYVAQQRVALLRDKGEIVAFATLMETPQKDEATVDLMRHGERIPGIAMEFLFLRLMEHFRAEGFRWFNLGMAPLAGLSDSEAAPAWHRIGRAVFEHGTRYYNFRGLRSFKAKFHPVWRARYLAVAGGLNPAIALFDTARLIGSRSKEEDR